MRKLVCWLAVIGTLAAAVAVTVRSGREARRVAARVRGETHARISALQSYLLFAASSDPAGFQSAVGSGLVVEATSIPQIILTNFPVALTPERMKWDLEDSWETPLRVEVRPYTESDRKDSSRYAVSVWSSGPNLVDERGKGDDLKVTNSIIDIIH
jgi:hypothetical protein